MLYGKPTATDDTDPSPTVSCTPGSGSTFAIGVTTIICTATDSSGNRSSVSFNINVVDTTAPSLTPPANIMAEAVSAGGAVVSYPAATATDAVDPAPVITYSQSSGTTFPLGVTTVTVTATDSSGNSSSASFKITVADNAAPSITVPANITAGATSPAGAVVNYPAATATDAVDPAPVITYSQSSGTTFPLGVTTVTVTATDSSGNSSSASFTITVKDTTPPNVTPPADIIKEATGPTTDVQLGTATSNDLVDGSLKPTPSESGPFSLGVHSIVWSATDAAGNTGTAIQTVTIVDTRVPQVFDAVIVSNPSAISIPLTLTASIDDSTTGGSPITSGGFNINNGTFIPMIAADGSFNTETENVVANITAFQVAGVHKICVHGKDAANNIGQEECILLAVYDPYGGYVTGGGWIYSPLGAYTANPSLIGKANFGFVSKYRNGATIPTGETEFQFKVADLNFHSESYEWLVVASARAMYKGLGTINGAGQYGFMLSAIDGQINGGGGSDRFRIKIWDTNSGMIVYDNQIGADEDAVPVTQLGGGSIVIHR